MPKTYNELYMALRQGLRAAEVDAFSLEARLLLAHAAEKTPEKLLAELQLYASEEIEQRAEEMLRRRLAGEPAAYLLGSWGFYGLDLAVAPGVLIPRSDTEVLVDTALELLRGNTAAPRVLDLCTGTGCIGCAIAANLPEARVVLADISETALALARENVRRCGLEARVQVEAMDVLRGPSGLIGSFDMIVSNPPYIESDEIALLDASVRDYEPHLALDGGADGLDFYRALLTLWKPLLRRAGQMVFEVGETQAEAVRMLMLRAQLHGIGMRQDSAGYDRVVFGGV